MRLVIVGITVLCRSVTIFLVQRRLDQTLIRDFSIGKGAEKGLFSMCFQNK